MNAEHNERVRVVEMKGLYADTVQEALREMRLLAAGTKADNPYYIVSMNPRADEVLTPEQWEQAVDTLEHNLGLDGHARCVVEHEKAGRVHRHIVFSRVDVDSMTVVPTNNNYLIHTETSRELEQLFGHQATPVPPAPERDRFKDWETFRAQESGLDLKLIKAQVTALFHASDNGAAFKDALQESGYVLCRGDKQGVLCIVDAHGDSHALLRRIDGVKAAELRAFMQGIDPQTLPSVAEAVALVKAQPESESGDSAARVLPEESRPASSLRTVEEFSAAHKKLLLSSPWGLEDEDTLLRRSYALEQARLAAIPEPPAPTPEPAFGKWAQQVTDQREQEKDKEMEL